MSKKFLDFQRVRIIRDFLGRAKNEEGTIIGPVRESGTLFNPFGLLMYGKGEVYEVDVPAWGAPPMCLGCGQRHAGWPIPGEFMVPIGKTPQFSSVVLDEELFNPSMH